MPTNSRCFVTVKCNRTTAIGGTIQPARAIDISPLSAASRLRHQSECVLSLPSSISPYALSSLPCTRAGAPACISSQRLASGLLSPSHSCTQTVGRSWSCDGNNCHIRGAVAGASFFAGAAGALGGAPAPFPAPLLQERQGKRSWPTVSPQLFHGSFRAHRSRGGLPAPKCRGFFGFCSVGIWEENGASNSLKVFVAALAQVVEVRHDG